MWLVTDKDGIEMKSRVAVFAVVLGLFVADVVSAQSIRVTLLGTGTPEASPDRFGPATLVEAGEEKLIFDVGRGATIRLAQAEVPLSDITVFLTHLHSDHTNGLSDLWTAGYMAPTFRDTPLEIYGPPGIVDLTGGLQVAYKPDIDIRTAEYAGRGIEFFPSGTAFEATEISREGIVFERGGVTVSAIAVEHGAGTAFGYRVDYGGRSVVISGDTRLSQNLMNKARGVDLIIHEVMAVADELMNGPQSTFWQSILTVHTTPEEAGSLFHDVEPKMAVFSHIGLVGVSEEGLETATRETYSGPLMVGRDLMVFLVDDKVSIENQR